MKTLSNELDIQVSTENFVEGYVTTKIYANGIGVFVGETYVPGDDASISVNVNDIVAQNHGRNDYLKLNDNGELTTSPLKEYYDDEEYYSRFERGQMCEYKVNLQQAGVQHNTAETFVAGYDYPNKDIKPTIIYNDADSDIGRIMQGCDWYVDYPTTGTFNNVLLPHIPSIPTKKFGFGLQLRDNTYNAYSIRLQFGRDVSLGTAIYESNMMFMTLYDFAQSFISLPNIDSYIWLKRKEFGSDIYGTLISFAPSMYEGYCPIAVLDGCYSRYYLAWNDRYGDIMSQPFEGKAEFSETFTKSEIQDYKMRRRVIHKETQPSWKLRTGWLKEDVYPIYEAIFTSPYVLLYDTQTDRAWNVIVTDNKYNEKTYKNQKSLISLELTVEANKTQNHIF